MHSPTSPGLVKREAVFRGGKTPFSPSMARHHPNPQHKPAKVGACFDACDALPELLAAAVVGDYRVVGAMFVMRQLNQAFRKAVNQCIKEWCQQYTVLKKEVLNAWVEQNVGDYFRLGVAAERMFFRAFGGGRRSVQSLGLLISKHTPKVYEDIVRRRCSMCSHSIKGEAVPSGGITTKSDMTYCDRRRFTFSCKRCEDKHVLMLTDDDLVGKPSMSANKVINYNHGVLADRMLAVLHFTEPIKSLNQLHDNTSPLTQLISTRAYGAVTPDSNDIDDVRRWIEPHPLVEDEDTLFGAEGITRRMVEDASDQAVSRMVEVRRAAERRKQRQLQEANEQKAGRRGQLCLQFAMAKLPWHTAAEMERFSPYLLKAILYDTFVEQNMSTPQRVVQKASYIYDVLVANRESRASKLSQSTIDFFLVVDNNSLIPEPKSDWAYRGTAWRGNVQHLRKLVGYVEAFDHTNFKVEYVRREGALSEEESDTWRGRMRVFNCGDTTTVCQINMHFPGMKDPTATIRASFSDAWLHRMNAAGGGSEQDQLVLTDCLDLCGYGQWRADVDKGRIAEVIEWVLRKALKTDERREVLEKMGLDYIMTNYVQNGVEYGVEYGQM